MDGSFAPRVILASVLGRGGLFSERRSSLDLEFGSGTIQSMSGLLSRVTNSPHVMGGKPCLRGMRVTVGTIVGHLAAGRSHQEILDEFPSLEDDDIRAALAYAAWRAEEQDLPLSAS